MRRYKPIVLSALVAVGVIFTAVASEAVAHAANSSSQGLQPPAIKERFSPVLPCSPNTTVGQEGCAERLVLADDRLLTRDTTAIFHFLHTTSARRDFVAAQTSWLTYRTKDCTSQSDVYQGGTEQPVYYANCLARDDVARRVDLKTFYVVLTQGLGSKAPAFP